MSESKRGRKPDLENLMARVDVLQKQIKRGEKAAEELPTVQEKIRNLTAGDGGARYIADRKRALLEKMAALEKLEGNIGE